jgi:hypothetical protein
LAVGARIDVMAVVNDDDVACVGSPRETISQRVGFA